MVLVAVFLYYFKEKPADVKIKEDELVEVNENIVKSKFLEYLKNISDNR